MERDVLATQLIAADQLLETRRELIDRQRAVIVELEAKGQSATAALATLDRLEQAQARYLEHRQLLADELKK